jgi:MFS family permease
MARRARRGGTFYGWYVALALFFSIFLSVGLRQGYGVFVSTWQDDFSVSVATVSIAAAVGWLMNGLAQPIFGRITDVMGGRGVILVSLLVMGGGSVAMAAVPNVYVLIGLYGFIISFATGGVSFTPAGVIVARWFRRKRGVAISLLTTGGSAGGLVLVPFAAYLLAFSNWRTAWLVMGLIILGLAVPLIALVVRSDPSDMGLQPDGDDAPTGDGVRSGPPAGPLDAKRWRDSLSSPPIWQLSLAYVVCGVTTASIAVHFVRWAESESISAGTAAIAFGVLSGINGLSIVAVGLLSDRMPRRVLLGGVYFIRAFAFLALVFLPGQAALWSFAIIGGMSWLATVPLTTALAADVYGVRHLGVLAGLINMTHQMGGAAAVYVFGLVFDRYNTYDPAYLAGAALLVLAAITALSIKERKYSARYSPVSAPASAQASATGDSGGP